MFGELYRLLNSQPTIGLGLEVEVLQGFYSADLSFRKKMLRKIRLMYYKYSKYGKK